MNSLHWIYKHGYLSCRKANSTSPSLNVIPDKVVHSINPYQVGTKEYETWQKGFDSRHDTLIERFQMERNNFSIFL